VLHDEKQEAHVEQATHVVVEAHVEQESPEEDDDGENNGEEDDSAGQGGGQQQVNYRLVKF
jgi:hypothetical protein